MTDAAGNRRAARERQRQYRQRAKRGIRIVRVSADEHVFAALEGAGLLHPAQADERQAVEEALTLAVRQWAERFFP